MPIRNSGRPRISQTGGANPRGRAKPIVWLENFMKFKDFGPSGGGVPSTPESANEKGINTKHPNFVLSCVDTSIKVTVLPLTYAVYSWSEHYKCALMQK